MAEPLAAMSPLGGATPFAETIGALRITERMDVALASLAVRRGCEEALAAAAAALGLPLPGPARREAGPVLAAFWTAPGQWFVEAPYASHADIVAALRPALGAAAALTEQTDGWVRLELGAADLAPLLERLCNLDFRAAPDGFATRTVIEHVGVYLLRHGAGEVTLLGPRSSAGSLLHAITTAARAIS